MKKLIYLVMNYGKMVITNRLNNLTIKGLWKNSPFTIYITIIRRFNKKKSTMN